MACLNSVDLIATAGRRLVRTFTAATGAAFRASLAAALSDSGWAVVSADVTGGANPGTGYKCTSAASPWCAPGAQPAEYVGRCKVWFYPLDTATANFKQLTEFKCMNEDETMLQPSSSIRVVPTTNNVFGNYSAYSYICVATPYDFKVFMLGVADRVAHGISNAQTAVFAGVPQIPSFLQARKPDSSAWCRWGINEMFYCVDASLMRTAGTYRDTGFFAAGVSSANGTYLNNNAGGSSTEARFAWFITFGIGDPTTSIQDYWVLNPGHTYPSWHGLLYPPIIAWATDPAAPATTRRFKGFMWDAVMVNKAYPGDAKLRFDNKEFIVFNNNWTGANSPLRPPAALLLRVA